jgi:hypothetical protein
LKITFKDGIPIDLSWDEFVHIHSKSLSAEKLAEIQYTLVGVGVYYGGGGSEPEFVVTASKEEIEDRFKIPPHMIPPPTDLPDRDQAT